MSRLLTLDICISAYCMCMNKQVSLYIPAVCQAWKNLWLNICIACYGNKIFISCSNLHNIEYAYVNNFVCNFNPA